MVELNEMNIDSGIKKGRILLMFYTEWCPLCPPIISILDELEKIENGQFLFARINFDQNPEAVKRYAIPGVPVVLAVRDGEILQGWAGLTDRNAYQEILHRVLYA